MAGKWEHPVEKTSTRDILEHAVNNSTWQKYRLAMKGKPTEEKLRMLRQWRAAHMKDGKLPKATQVQIDNYINALKRGGQLTKEGHIQR